MITEIMKTSRRLKRRKSRLLKACLFEISGTFRPDYRKTGILERTLVFLGCPSQNSSFPISLRNKLRHYK